MSIDFLQKLFGTPKLRGFDKTMEARRIEVAGFHMNSQMLGTGRVPPLRVFKLKEFGGSLACDLFGSFATYLNDDLHSIFHRVFEGHLDSKQYVWPTKNRMRRIAHVRFCVGSGRVIAQSYPDDQHRTPGLPVGGGFSASGV